MRSGRPTLDALRKQNKILHAFSEFFEGAGPPRTTHASECSKELEGTFFGVKDVIDVAGMATRNGSRTCESLPPAKVDAPVISALQRAGARLAGKTVTTE